MDSHLQGVLYFRSSAVFAGPERYLVELGRALPEFGFEVELLALYRRSSESPAVHPLVARARAAGLPAEQWPDPGPLSIQTVFQLADWLRRGRYALLHSQDYKTDVIGVLAARFARVPCVATVHLHPQTTWRLRFYRQLDLVALRLCHQVITVSEAIRQELLAAGLAPDRVVTIHNGLDVAEFEASGQEVGGNDSRGNDVGQPTVAVFGRLDPQKRQSDFLLAARQVHATRPDVRFMLVGDGPDRASLEQLAQQLGIADCVRFAGHQTNVAALLQRTSVVVLSSVREGLPYVLLEALALARPVVATAVGGVPEVITHGETGLLVPPCNPSALAEGILWVLNNPAEAIRLGERGQERVLREFSATEMAHCTANVYRQVLDKGGSSDHAGSDR